MFYILDGRETFYQWDLDRMVVVKDETIKEVHFCNGTEDYALIVAVVEQDGKRVAAVPNILLQKPLRVRVYGYTENFTKYCEVFEVVPRNKPDTYAYTETEIKRYEELESRVAALEEGGTGGGGSGCECKELIIKLVFAKDSVSQMVNFSMPIEDVFALTIEELREYDIRAYDEDNHLWTLQQITKTDDKIVFTFAYIYISSDGRTNGICEVDFGIAKQTDGTLYTAFDGVANQHHLYTLPSPQVSGRKYLVVENENYTLVDDVGTGSGDSSENTEPPTIIVYDVDGELILEESQDLSGVMEHIPLSIMLVVDAATGTKAAMYRVAEMSMDETNPYLVFADGTGKAIKLNFADVSIAYVPLFVDGEGVSY